MALYVKTKIGVSKDDGVPTIRFDRKALARASLRDIERDLLRAESRENDSRPGHPAKAAGVADDDPST